ncbi:hypothetical protein E8E11_002070 [Didymella keratinophila]|nr:hypothetical protein E8E11_002070 [Didymella keratinophila]
MLEPDLFPLPTELKHRLRTISHNLHKGVGLAVLRGLDPKRYSDEDNLIIYTGIVSWIGRERATNPLGMSAEHVRNALLDKKPAGAAESELEPAKQAHRMNFHADRFMADVVALYVREKAASGGEQYVASFQSIYNELSSNHPKALTTLMEDWVWPPSPEDRNADPIKGPVVFSNGEQVIAQLVWAPFIKNPSYLAPERERALTIVNDLAKKMCVKLDSKAGDIQLVNNLGMLHARDSFVDNATQHRHLVRIGIRDPEHQWARPVGFGTQFETAYRVPLSEQKMPTVDFDPWDATSTAALNHG